MVSNFHFRLNFHVASFLFTVFGCQRSRFEPWWVQIVSMPSAVLAVQRDSFVGTESAQAVIIYNSAVIYGSMLEGIRVVFRAETGGVLTQIQRISLVFSWLYSCGWLHS